MKRPQPAQKPEGVIIHALKALECCAGRGVGPNGLYLFGSGDWSDGMDSVGGESVWLTWFFAHCAERLSRLLSQIM
jgi:cellobiose phosphorylase